MFTDTALIVEDQVITALDLKQTLKTYGYSHVTIMNKGKNALDFIENEPLSVALLDIKLADDVSGIDVAKKLQQKSIPFIFISAFSNPENFRLANELKPAGILKKPFREQSVKTLLNKLFHLPG
ncbi:MAG: response regulator [Ignavibacteriaceae bacterium]